jgi:ssDNA-binding Zn-finger/Zn-ribbon topoisomerase 1
MKKISNKTLPKKEKFEGITISEQDTGEDEGIDYICPSCHQNLVKISDRQGNNEEWFCRNCSIPYLDSKEIRYRHRLNVPQETESAVSIVDIDYGQEVKIRHEPELKGGFAQLAKKGTIRFTSYEERKG